MRIIAGSLKGRRLSPPEWPGLRPTSDKLRETLFNVLATRVVGARVLDGFAGTGAIGIEAISRGAAHVTFVEQDRRAAALVEDNLRRCGVREGYVIIRRDLLKAVPIVATSPFELVLLDPPYDEPDFDRLLQGVEACLAGDGLLVLEHARRRAVPDRAGTLARTRTIVSGDSALSLFVRAAGAVEEAPST